VNSEIVQEEVEVGTRESRSSKRQRHANAVDDPRAGCTLRLSKGRSKSESESQLSKRQQCANAVNDPRAERVLR
jgi:hypothetical protein